MSVAVTCLPSSPLRSIPSSRRRIGTCAREAKERAAVPLSGAIDSVRQVSGWQAWLELITMAFVGYNRDPYIIHLNIAL